MLLALLLITAYIFPRQPYKIKKTTKVKKLPLKRLSFLPISEFNYLDD